MGRLGFSEVRSIIMGEAGRAEIRSDARARSPQLQLMRQTTGTEPPSVSSPDSPVKPVLSGGHVRQTCAAFLVLGCSVIQQLRNGDVDTARSRAQPSNSQLPGTDLTFAQK